INIAYTGGYEFVFQRSLAYLFGVSLIFLSYGEQESSLGKKILAIFLFMISLIVLGYPALMADYLNSRLFYVDPLKLQDYIFGTIA
ncbi:MAG: hypothetical protein ACKVIK_14275, partial [Rhodospirillales bacterium]